MSPRILYIDHSHHSVTQSTRFLLEYLQTIGDVSVEYEDCWKTGLEPKNYLAEAAKFDLVVVFQLPQVILQLCSAGLPNLVFIPMYDSVVSWSDERWRLLAQVKMVSFSASVHAICLTHGLDSYSIQYYPESSVRSPAGYQDLRMFFWQRLRNPNWRTVTGMLPLGQFAMLHHHVALDPGVKMVPEENNDPTPSERRQPNFGESSWFESKSDLLEEYAKFNLYFIPREKEGIGFSFLDAMERGMVPVGFDRPTFNEYVVDGLNGFIVDRKWRYDLPPLEEVADNMRKYLNQGRIRYERQLAGLRTFLFKPVSSSVAIPSWIEKRVPPLYRRRLRNRQRRSEVAVTATRESFSKVPEPLVSIITIANSSAAGLTRTFQSVFSQSHPSIEYIVVDCQSGARDLIDRHAASIDLVVKDRNTAPCDLLANAARAASGKFILHLDPGDELVDATSIEDAFLGAPNDVGVIYGHRYQFSRSGHVSLRHARNLKNCFQALRNTRNSFPAGWDEDLPTPRSAFLAKSLLVNIATRHFSTTDASLVIGAMSQGAVPYHANIVITRTAASRRGASHRVPNYRDLANGNGLTIHAGSPGSPSHS